MHHCIQGWSGIAAWAGLPMTELIKLVRDPTEVISRAVQPVLWLVVFGQVLAQVRGIQTGKLSYLAFITPGILAQSVLFSAIFYGIAIIWERDLGVVHKLLASPARPMRSLRVSSFFTCSSVSTVGDGRRRGGAMP